MTLSKKIIYSLLGSILFIAIINIVSFYVFYSLFFQSYLANSFQNRDVITREYIDEILQKQALDDVDEIFMDGEILFFEALERGDGKISLDDDENIGIVINYLIKSGVNIKYIEEFLPQNYLQKVLDDLQDSQTQEYIFFNRLIISVFITNIIALFILIIFLAFFTKKILSPIEKTTKEIKNLKLGKDFKIIPYDKQDEIGLLVNAINGLNIKLNIGENIRSTLLADISHELKTPITAISCYMEGIKDGVIQIDERILNSITSEMERLTKLVNTIMDYEKFESDELKLNITQEDIRFVTQEVIKQFKQKLKNTNQKITTSGLHKTISLDRDIYIQIVQNIISNFIKYAGKDTLLKIEFGVNFIKFSDNGVGVSSSDLPYIKEKFYQADKQKTGDIDKRGIGVGLSIVEKLIKSLGWEFEIFSQKHKGFEIKIFIKK